MSYDHFVIISARSSPLCKHSTAIPIQIWRLSRTSKPDRNKSFRIHPAQPRWACGSLPCMGAIITIRCPFVKRIACIHFSCTLDVLIVRTLLETYK